MRKKSKQMITRFSKTKSTIQMYCSIQKGCQEQRYGYIFHMFG